MVRMSDVKTCVDLYNRDLVRWDSQGEAMSINTYVDSCILTAPPAGIETRLEWYAVRTRSRHEKMVHDRLAGVGIEPFLPLTRQLSQWSDRKVMTEWPLFAGYCFARFSLTNRRSILQIPGVAGIVGAVGPEAIPDAELDAIKIIALKDRHIERHDYFSEGTWVEVARGPLVGLRGQFVRRAGQSYIVIRIHLIQQAAAVHIHTDDVISLS